MDKLGGLISIARKAGFCIIGQDKLKNYDKKLYIILISKTAGNSLEREMTFLAKEKNIPLLWMEELDNLTGINNCKVIGIKNKELSEQIAKIIKGE